MPEVSSVQQGGVRAAVARAAAATGVNFDYLLAQARIESALDPSAQAATSSAAGLYQFTAGTWLETLDRHGARHGLHWADDAIARTGGRAQVVDPQLRSQVMALRHDPDTAALMAAELALDNATELRGTLGREPDASELYLAHFLGSGGARTFLVALAAEPGQSAAALLPQAAAANRPIFYDGGRTRSVGEVMELVRGKMTEAMAGGASVPENASPSATFELAARRSRPTAAGEAGRRPVSMADTLHATFGPPGQLPGAAGERVGRAYAALKAFDL